MVVVATEPDPLRYKDVSDLADHVVQYPTTEQHISRWWNAGLDYIEEKTTCGTHEVLAISSDYAGTPYSVAVLGAFLRRHGLTMVGPDHHTSGQRFLREGEPRGTVDRVPGACWMLAGESALRVDTDFRWWYSDDDLEMQARKRGGAGVIAGTGLEPGPDSYLSEEKAIWAAEDRERFRQKWGKYPW